MLLNIIFAVIGLVLLATISAVTIGPLIIAAIYENNRRKEWGQ